MDKSLGNAEKSELLFLHHLGPEIEAMSPAKKFKDLRTMRPRLQSECLNELLQSESDFLVSDIGNINGSRLFKHNSQV